MLFAESIRPQSKPAVFPLMKLLIVLMGVSGFQHSTPPDRKVAMEQYEQAKKLIRDDAYEAALPLLKNSLDVLRRTGPDSVAASACILLDQCFYALEDFEAGIHFFNELSQKKENTPYLAAYVLLLLGDNFYSNGNYPQAIETYEAGVLLAEQERIDSIQYKYYGALGWLYWDAGDHAKGQDLKQKALEIVIRRNNKPVMARLFSDIGDNYRNMRNPVALDYFRRSIALEPDHPQRRIQFSKAYQTFHKPDSAVWMLRSAIPLLHEKEDITDLYYQFAFLSVENRDVPQALTYIKKSLDAAGYPEGHPEYDRIIMLAGKIYLAAGNIRQSLFWFDQVLYHGRPATGPQQFKPNSHWVLGSLEGKGKALRLRYRQTHDFQNLSAAVDAFETGLQYAEKMRLSYSAESSKLELYEYVQPVIEGGVEALLEMAHATGDSTYVEKAFLFAERAKAPVMAEALYDKGIKKISGIPDSVLEQEKVLQQQISDMELAVYEEPANDTLQKDLRQIRLDLQRLKDDIQKRFPRYYSLKYAFSKQTTLQQIAGNLDDQSMLIQYLAGDSTLYAFTVFRGKVKTFSIPMNQAFIHTLGRFYRTVSDWDFVHDHPNEAERDFLETAPSLYQSLMAQALDGTDARRLIIVPDGQLGLIPFETLLSAPFAGTWTDLEIPYLVKKYAVSYAWSAGALHKSDPNKPDPTYNFAGFGTEYERIDTTKIPVFATRDLGRLPYADDEVRAVSDLLSGKTWLNEAATRDNFMVEAPRCGILHVATHGFLNEANPMMSYLAFQPISGDSSYQVFASELYNLPLQARMAVLSACNTGKGTVQNGEGVMSLARAFAFAGCPTLVSSLWSVNDLSTSRIMKIFYRSLQEQATIDVALQQAKLEYLKTAPSGYTKPIYWAAFVTVGDSSPLPENLTGRSRFWIWLLAGSILGLTAVLLYWKKRRSRLTT